MANHWKRLIWCFLLLLAGAGYLHLTADFPNHSRWADDAAKFGDEGWWASGAIHRTLIGHWLIPGDYNPMVSVPLWSVLLAALFHFTGVSIAVARGTAFTFTIGTVLVIGALVRRSRPAWAPLAMLVVGSSATLYFFSHLAILEPPLLFFLSAAALAAYASRPVGPLRGLLCGLLLVLAMFTKSSALAAMPAVFYLLWFPHRRLWHAAGDADLGERRRWLMGMATAAATLVVCYSAYWVMVLRPHAVDVRVFYDNNRPVLDHRSLEKAVRLVYRCFTWIDPILFPLALAGVALSFGRLKSLRQEPLFGYAVLFFLGYAAFIVYHFEGPPRYFAVLVVPVALLAVLLLGALHERMPQAYRVAGVLVLAAVAISTVTIARAVARPQYTYRDACLAMKARMDADPSARRLIIGHTAVETTYFTGIMALDDLGSMPIDRKIDLYRPDWLFRWDAEPLNPPPSNRKMVLVGTYSAYDDPVRSGFLLYRLEPK